jgi:probable HAF family extracellular repeat protein
LAGIAGTSVGTRIAGSRGFTTCFTAMTLFASLVLPIQLAAQHARYKFIDIGTLGGPVSNVPGNGGEGLSNDGIVVGAASTPEAVHAFSWKKGVITDLGTLPSADNTLSSGANGVNARGWVVGNSNTGGFDPLTNPDIGEQHTVLWKNGEIIDLGTLG